MQLKTFVFNPFQVNSYLLYDETGDALLIDASMMSNDEQESFRNFVQNKNLNLKKIIFTHGHADHVAGSSWLNSNFSPEILIHKADKYIFDTAPEFAPLLGLDIYDVSEIHNYLNEGDNVKIGDQKLEVIHSPGHTPGGICLVHHETKKVFTGDSLFAGSVGRTDLPGGNHSELMASLNVKLKNLPADYEIYPGHGPSSDIGTEKNINPFIND